MAARLTAEQLYARAVAAGNAGRHAAARRDLLAARIRSPDPDTAALVAGTLAYLDSETGSPEASIAQIEQVLAGDEIGESTRAVLISQRGLLALRQGRADDAIRDLSTAIERLDDRPVSLGRAHLNRGLVRLERSDPDGAEHDFALAAAAFARAGDPVEEAKAHSNEGYAAMLRGDLARAIRTMDAAAGVLGPLSPVMGAICDGDRAEALLAAGMTTDAVRLLRGVVRVYGSRRLRQAQAEAEVLLARCLLVEHPAEAAAVARRAARRLRARGNDSWAVRADALVLTGRLRTGDARAGSAVRATAAELDTLHRDDDAALLRLELAMASIAADRATDAADARQQARPTPSSSIAVQVRAHEVDAELARMRGDTAAVRAASGAGIETLSGWQSRLGSLELHSSAAVYGRRLAALGVRAAIDGGDGAEVLAWSERVRALGNTLVPLRPPADDRVARALTELRELRLADDPTARSREAELRDAVRRIHWADAGDGASTRSAVALDELLEALAADGAAFAAHLWTGDSLAALVIAPAATPAVRIVELGPVDPVARLLAGLLADLDIAAASLPASLRATADAALAGRLATLDGILVAPVADALGGAQRLVLTPAGIVAGIPWTMLPTVGGRPLVVAESARRWLDARGTARRVRRAGFASGPDVARAGAEIAAAAGAWPASDPLARPLARPLATAAEVTGLAEHVDLLHIAAHGRHSAEHPLFSGFELADGPWFGYDIDLLGRVPPLVIMSACELGRSTSHWGMEALGMARAWLHAGTRSVLAAPAAVADESAAQLLPAVHRELARGAGLSDALSTATTTTGITTPLLVRGSGW